MRNPHPFWQSLQAAAVAGLVVCFVAACKPASKPAASAKPVAAKTSSVASSTNTASAATSTFDSLMPPKGRDPFFPNSHRRDPVVAKGASPEKPMAAAELVLKGIVGSPGHRLALINENAILEVGESMSVRVATGHVRSDAWKSARILPWSKSKAKYKRNDCN